MSSTPSLRNAVSQPAIPNTPENRPVRASVAVPPVDSPISSKPAGYGLPCARCRVYYPADLKACPVCKSSERVSPTPPTPRVPVSISHEATPDLSVIEQERERFLKEFKAQMASFELPGQASFARCICEENHPDQFASAVICQDCYERLQERVDVLEAALHMDLKEAAQIVYQAVWADPSDVTKTYQNAAQALLSELRKRSGVPLTFALVEPPMAD